jgi:hypothetical protein
MPGLQSDFNPVTVGPRLTGASGLAELPDVA